MTFGEPVVNSTVMKLYNLHIEHTKKPPSSEVSKSNCSINGVLINTQVTLRVSLSLSPHPPENSWPVRLRSPFYKLPQLTYFAQTEAHIDWWKNLQ